MYKVIHTACKDTQSFFQDNVVKRYTYNDNPKTHWKLFQCFSSAWFVFVSLTFTMGAPHHHAMIAVEHPPSPLIFLRWEVNWLKMVSLRNRDCRPEEVDCDSKCWEIAVSNKNNISKLYNAERLHVILVKWKSGLASFCVSVFVQRVLHCY